MDELLNTNQNSPCFATGFSFINPSKRIFFIINCTCDFPVLWLVYHISLTPVWLNHISLTGYQDLFKLVHTERNSVWIVCSCHCLHDTFTCLTVRNGGFLKSDCPPMIAMGSKINSNAMKTTHVWSWTHCSFIGNNTHVSRVQQTCRWGLQEQDHPCIASLLLDNKPSELWSVSDNSPPPVVVWRKGEALSDWRMALVGQPFAKALGGGHWS